jgi:hypothetical protein
MTLKFVLICAGSWMLVSCDPKNSSESSGTAAAGIYVREYVTEITNQNTGDKIGTRKVRDTIIIERIEDDEFKITNRKWRMNDYDQDGWVSMEHADDRPLPTFLASYDETSSELLPKGETISHSIFLDQENGKIFKNKSRDIEYVKVE